MDDIVDSELELQRKRVKSSEVSSSASGSQSSKRVRLEHLPDGIYHIINIKNSTYAALLSDADRLDVVNIIFGLNVEHDRGSKWLLTHLGQRKYTIQNAEFKSFASYDTRPEATFPVLGKRSAIPFPWVIRLGPVQGPATYNISPLENPDVFWMGGGDVHGTPLELGWPSTARQCCWALHAVGTTTVPQSVVVNPYSTVRERFNLNTLLEHLPTVQSARYETDPRPKCLAGTRVKLLQEIREWIADGTSSPIFWLRGQAGTGKTTISLTVAEECARGQRLGASFLFSRDQADRSELQHVFPTIARQLGALHEEYGALVAQVLAKEPGVGDFLPLFQLERLIIQPLAQCQDFPSPVVVVIDALDECKDNSPISTLLHLLRDHLPHLRKLKFFVTSRPEPHIQSAFSTKLQQETTFLTLHNIEATQVDEDIKLFIQTALSTGAKIYPDLVEMGWPSAGEVVTLVKLSAQLFIYAATIVRAALDREWDDPKARLAEILESSGGKQTSGGGLEPLDQLYLYVLKTAYPNQVRTQVIDQLRRILGTILILTNPLSASAVEGLLGIARGTVRRVLHRLHSVLVVPDEEDVPIRIIHPSFFDFLTTRCADDRFLIDIKAHQTQLAICCFGVMHTKLKHNICQLDDPSKLNAEVKDLGDRIQQFLPLPLQYACRSWAVHVSCSEVTETLLDHFNKFSSRQLLNWIEVLSLLGFIREGADRLRAARLFLEVTPPEGARFLYQLGRPSHHSGISSLLRDCSGFMSLYYDVLSTSALHVHISAFGSLHRNSILKRTYQDQIPVSFRILSDRERDLPSVMLGEPNVKSFSFSLDGVYLLSIDFKNNLRVWHTTTASLLTSFKLEGYLHWVQLLPDNTRVVYCSRDYVLRFWDIPSQRLVKTIPLNPGIDPNIRGGAFVADAAFTILGVAWNSTRFFLWDTSTWELRTRCGTPKGYAFNVVSRGNKITAVASSRLPQTTHLAAIKAFNKGSRALFILHINSDSVRPYEIDIPSSLGEPECFDFSPDELCLAVGTTSGRVFIYDVVAGVCLGHWAASGTFSCHDIAFTGGGARLLTCTSEELESWSFTDDVKLKLRRSIYKDESRRLETTKIASSSGGQLAFNRIEALFLTDGDPYNVAKVTTSHTPSVGWMADACLTPDGSYIFGVVLPNRSISCLNLNTSAVWEGGRDVLCAMSSPDSQHILAGTKDGTVLLYKIGSSTDPVDLYEHSGGVALVGFSLDGAIVISADAAGSVYIWDLHNQHMLQQFQQQDSGPLKMPLGSSLPSLVWRVTNPISEQSADFLGFEQIDLADSSDFLLCCKSRTIFATARLNCGVMACRIDGVACSFSFEVVAKPPVPGQAVTADAYNTPLHYHIDGSWISSCCGTEATSRRCAWLPPQWKQPRFKDASGGHMLIYCDPEDGDLRVPVLAVLDVRGLIKYSV